MHVCMQHASVASRNGAVLAENYDSEVDGCLHSELLRTMDACMHAHILNLELSSASFSLTHALNLFSIVNPTHTMMMGLC